MNNILKIISQAFFSILGKVYLILLGFWFKYYLANNLEDAAYSLGIFALGMTIINIISPFASLGLGPTATRFIPKWKVEGKLHYISSFIQTSTLVMLLFSGLFFVLVIWKQDIVLKYFSANSKENLVLSQFLLLFLIMMMVKNISELFVQFLRGFQQVKRSTIVTTFVGVTIKVLLVVLLISNSWGLKGYVYGELIASIVVSLILGIYLGKSVGFRLQLNKKWLNKEVLSYSGTLLLLSILSMILGNLDRVLLGHLSISDLGIYYMAFSFIPFLEIFLTSVNSIFAPVISQVWSEGRLNELKLLYQFFTKWVLLLTFPIVYVMIYFGEEFLLLFGEEFIAGKYVLVFLALAHLVNVSFGSVGMLLQMTGQHVKVLKINIFNTVVTATLMLSLIPKYGLQGAALASAMGIIVYNILSYIIMYKKLKLIPYQKDVWKIILSCFVSVSFLCFVFSYIDFQNSVFSLLFIAFITFIVFMLFAFVICFSKADKKVFLQIIKR